MNAPTRVALSAVAAAALLTMASSQTAPDAQGEDGQLPIATVQLPDIYMRDACILPDPATQTYYIVASGRGATVRAYTSKFELEDIGETLRIKRAFP